MGNVCASKKAVQSRESVISSDLPSAPRNAEQYSSAHQEFPILKGIPQWEFDVNEGGSPAIDTTKNAGNVFQWLGDVDSDEASQETIQYLSPQAREDPPNANALTIEWLPSRYDATAPLTINTQPTENKVSALDLRTPMTAKKQPCQSMFAVYGRRR